MGIYIYSMRKPVKHIEYLGQVYETARLGFLRKPNYSSGDMDRITKACVAKCEGLFDSIPELAVMDDKWVNGMEVYRYRGKKPWTIDTPRIDGYVIGKLNLPALKVIPNEYTHMPWHWVEAGQQFKMSEVLVRHFNAQVLDQSWIPVDRQKDVTQYTVDDLFVMASDGEFSVFKNGYFRRYSTNHLPQSWGEWDCKVWLLAEDSTNYFEGLYS